jgi:flagellar biosynthesis protein FlhA
MSLTAVGTAPAANRGGKDIAFAVGIVLILCLFFLPVPAVMIDFGLALSIALSVLILMVALWIQKPLEFSAFPTVLLVATILRLALNISTTRLILSHGEQGPTSAGYIIGGFAALVMGGDFVIGIIVFLILVTINFLVITKGATRIAEVGARFTLDAIPGKQMAIDADLSAGLIDEKVAQARRRELEEESAFFGSMDGASKFVRGDADPGAYHFARRRPACGQGRHARLGRQSRHRPAERLSQRPLSGSVSDGGAGRRSGAAVPALRAHRRIDGLRRHRHPPAH